MFKLALFLLLWAWIWAWHYEVGVQKSVVWSGFISLLGVAFLALVLIAVFGLGPTGSSGGFGRYG